MNPPLVDDRAVVVFDLDGTLVAGSSFGQFVRLLICRSPWRLLIAAVSMPLAVVLLVPRRSRAVPAVALVWLATAGRKEAELRRRARTFAGWHAGAESGNRIGLALARLAAHQRSGAQIVVATAAAQPVASEVVRALGIVGAQVLAPRLARVRGGWVPEGDSRGNAKVARLRAAGYALPVEYAYSDSSRDIALFRAARYPVAVQPGRISWRAIQIGVPDCSILTSVGLR